MNIEEYKQQKKINNQFLALYKKYKVYQLKQNNYISTNNLIYNDLFYKYQQNNHPVPKNALEGNIFNKDPLLIVNKNEIKEYFQKYPKRDLKTQPIINKLNHFQFLAYTRAKQVAETLNSGGLIYLGCINNKKMSDENSNMDILYDKRDSIKLKKEIQQNKQYISLYSGLMNEISFEKNESNDIDEYIIKPYQSIIKEPHNIVKHFNHKKAFSQANTIKKGKDDNGKNNKIVLTSNYLVSSQNKKPISTLNTITSLQEKNKSKNSTFSSTYYLHNKKRLKEDSCNSYLQNYCELKQNNENELFYNIIKQEKLYNKTVNSNDIIIQLSNYFNESLYPKNTIKELLSSFSEIEAQVKRIKLAKKMKKLQIKNISLDTSKTCRKIKSVDASLCSSKEKIMKKLLHLQI